MRIIPVALFVILFLIIGIPVLGIEWLIGKISKKTMLFCLYITLRLLKRKCAKKHKKNKSYIIPPVFYAEYL